MEKALTDLENTMQKYRVMAAGRPQGGVGSSSALLPGAHSPNKRLAQEDSTRSPELNGTIEETHRTPDTNRGESLQRHLVCGRSMY